jgi:hypothetical protein
VANLIDLNVPKYHFMFLFYLQLFLMFPHPFCPICQVPGSQFSGIISRGSCARLTNGEINLGGGVMAVIRMMAAMKYARKHSYRGMDSNRRPQCLIDLNWCCIASNIINIIYRSNLRPCLHLTTHRL